VTQGQPATQPASTPTDPSADVRALLAKGDTKQAVERAKALHKHLANDASQTLLVEAYLARIRSLSDRGLAAEAKALTDVVWERFPSARPALADTRATVTARMGNVDELIRPLADPSLPPEKRASIETALRRQLANPADLAESEALPADHALRVAAAAVASALARVTQGRMEDDQLHLPEVSRKGPLAPWKPLVRAIAALHRREDATCETCLAAIEPDSAPARLVPAMRAMLAAKRPAGLKTAAASLVNQVAGDPGDLRDALAAFDASINGAKRGKVVRAIGRAIQACDRSRPDLLQRLRQEISARALLADLPFGAVRGACGAPSLRTAHFWRLRARAEEMLGNSLMAAAIWEEFRAVAIGEGWFEADSLESAAVLLHQAELLKRIPSREMRHALERFRATFKGFAAEYADQPRAIAEAASKRKTDFGFLSPEGLYEKAARMAPAAETFRKWWELATDVGANKKDGDEAALAWSKALPQDARPLLLLMESAEDRDALKKALGYLEEAERLDALNPLVRKARVRLHVAVTLRHLKQKKFHLVEKDLAELESAPHAQEGRRAAFVPAVRVLLAAHDKREVDEATWRHQASIALGSEAAAFLLVWAIAEGCGIKGPRGLTGPAETAEKLSNAIARVALLAADLGLSVGVPPAWRKAVRETVAARDCPLDAESLRAIAEAALSTDDSELAYAISGAGLARRGPTTARFLLLRARCLPTMGRRFKCASAAASLAREQRDLEVANEAVELCADDYLGPERVTMAAVEVEKLVVAEIAAKAYPSSGEIYVDTPLDDMGCPCPSCCARRRMGGGEPDDDEEDDDGDLLDIDGPPPELVQLMLEITMKHSRIGGDPPDLEEVMKKDPELVERLLRIMKKYGIDGLPPFPGGRRGRRW